ncbi:MAG: ABC transporter permease [Planctomycetes bacterium]|nr:ABC transporter permease [Planctomycetota bacterium]
MLADATVTLIFTILGYVLGGAFLGLTAGGVLYSLYLTVRMAGVFPLGLRYASSRIINLVAVVGVAIGVAAVIVVMSVMNGFISEQRKLIRGSLADLSILPAPRNHDTDGRPSMPGSFDEYKKILDGTPHVVAIAPRFVWVALLFPPDTLNKFNLARRGSDFIVQLIGIDPEAEKKVSNFNSWIGPIKENEAGASTEERLIYQMVNDPADPLAKFSHPGSISKESMIVGVVLARNIKLKKGTRVEIVTFSPQSTREKHDTPNMFCDIAGMLHTQEQEFDSHSVIVTIPALQKLLSEEASDFTEIIVKLDDYKNADAARIEIGRRLKAAGLLSARGYSVLPTDVPLTETDLYRREIHTWEDQKATFLRAVENERGILGFIVFVVVVVAAFIQFAILSMMVTEKTRDIGILSTLGGSGGEILAVFVDVGLAITTSGAALGLGLALVVSANLNKIDDFIEFATGNRIFDPDVYFLKSIPSEIDWIQVLCILGLTLGAGVLSSLFPAWRASRLHPARALRYE